MRNNYIDWDTYFMMVSIVSGLRSKDPYTQVGACIVSPDKKIIGVGYNGLPTGCKDEDYPWDNREGELADTKYPYICHAELNAILNSTVSVKGSTIYVSLFPCNECAKAIIQSGISEIVYLSDKYKDTPTDKISRRMLGDAGVKCRKITIPYNINLIPRDINSTEENFVSVSGKTVVNNKETKIDKAVRKKMNKSLISKEIFEYNKVLYVIDRAKYKGEYNRLNEIEVGTVIRNSSGDLLVPIHNGPTYNLVIGKDIKQFDPKIETYFITDGEITNYRNLSLELYDSGDTLCSIKSEIKEFCRELDLYRKLDNITLFVYKLPLATIVDIKDAIKEYDFRHVFHVAYIPVSNKVADYYHIDELEGSLIGRSVYSVENFRTLTRIYENELKRSKEENKK